MGDEEGGILKKSFSGAIRLHALLFSISSTYEQYENPSLSSSMSPLDCCNSAFPGVPISVAPFPTDPHITE